MKKLLGILVVLGLLAAIGIRGAVYLSRHEATVPIEQTYVPNPTLAEPNPEGIPNVNVVEVTPWPQGAMPAAAQGLVVHEFAGGLEHPRQLHVLPNGDVLVVESNAPPKPEEGFSFRGFFVD